MKRSPVLRLGGLLRQWQECLAEIVWGKDYPIYSVQRSNPLALLVFQSVVHKDHMHEALHRWKVVLVQHLNQHRYRSMS